MQKTLTLKTQRYIQCNLNEYFRVARRRLVLGHIPSKQTTAGALLVLQQDMSLNGPDPRFQQDKTLGKRTLKP